MHAQQKEILRGVVEYPLGLISQSQFFNSICKGDKKTAHILITSGFIEEVTRKIRETNQDATFYRPTLKGQAIFYPWYRRLWYLIKGDVRTIIVATIISLITSLVTISLSH